MRVKGGYTTRQRRNSIKKKASGAWGTKHTSYKIAHQTVIEASGYAYRDRRNKKRDFRKLWISRINAGLRPLGYSYSKFIAQLNKKNIKINRKMLSELAISNPEEFKKLATEAMK